MRFLSIAFLTLLSSHAPAHANPAGIDWQVIKHSSSPEFSIARTETTVAQFRRFANATSLLSFAESLGGGLIYENGWQRKQGWSWQAPYGKPAAQDEPAAYITYDEAQQFCRWAGGQLPTDVQWLTAAYIETRPTASPPFTTGKTYQYPTGDTPQGAHCLEGCGSPKERAVTNGQILSRGLGHARVGTTKPGVNGLFDMGANLWEWVNAPGVINKAAGSAKRRTRGGSWWYGPSQMKADYVENKPGDYAVAYIGFRCAR